MVGIQIIDKKGGIIESEKIEKITYKINETGRSFEFKGEIRFRAETALGKLGVIHKIPFDEGKTQHTKENSIDEKKETREWKDERKSILKEKSDRICGEILKLIEKNKTDFSGLKI